MIEKTRQSQEKQGADRPAALPDQQVPVGAGKLDEPPAEIARPDMVILVTKIEALTESNKKLATMLRRQMVSNSLRMSMVRGMSVGFGWVIGTTLVVALFVFFLQQFITVPFIGEFVKRIVEYVEHSGSTL